jgi:hypothetical protein
MSDYSLGKIYKITSPQTNKVYVGSTVQSLKERLIKHRYDYNSYLNHKHNFVTSFEIIKFEDHKIELVEQYPCQTKKELSLREGFWIREIATSVNIAVAGRTKAEYYLENRDVFINKAKKYRQDNLEKVKEKQRKFYEENKERLKTKKKEYYEASKKIQSLRKAEKISCECGSVVSRGGFAQHKKSEKHKKFMAEKEEESSSESESEESCSSTSGSESDSNDSSNDSDSSDE